MAQAAKSPRQNRTITVDFNNEATYSQLLDDTKAFLEGVLAFILSIGFQLHHKSTCARGGSRCPAGHARRSELGAVRGDRPYLPHGPVSLGLCPGQAELGRRADPVCP